MATNLFIHSYIDLLWDEGVGNSIWVGCVSFRIINVFILVYSLLLI